MPGRMLYHIRIREQLSPDWAAWFDPLTISDEPGGRTVLSGILPDQAALHGMLIRIRDLRLTLIALSSAELDEAGEPASSHKL